MKSMLAEKNESILPSQALNRDFGLVDLPFVSMTEEHGDALVTHAIMIGNIGLLLPNDQISELLNRLAVCRLPNTAAWFAGVTSVRGNMIPVFDLHRLFGIESTPQARRTIVVSEHETAVAFHVDGFPRLVSLEEEDGMTSTPPIPALVKDHARKYYLKDGQIWVDWDIHTFFKTLGGML